MRPLSQRELLEDGCRVMATIKTFDECCTAYFLILYLNSWGRLKLMLIVGDRGESPNIVVTQRRGVFATSRGEEDAGLVVPAR